MVRAGIVSSVEVRRTIRGETTKIEAFSSKTSSIGSLRRPCGARHRGKRSPRGARKALRYKKLADIYNVRISTIRRATRAASPISKI